MSYFKQLPKKIKYLEIASRLMLLLFGIFLLTLQNCQRYFNIYFLGNDITMVIWLCGLVISLSLSIIFEIISLKRLKQYNLPTKEPKKSFIVFFIIFVVISFLLSIVLISPCSSTHKAKNSRIMSAITQARTNMTATFGKYGNYDNFNCQQDKDMLAICDDIDQIYSQKNRKFFEIEIHNSNFSKDGKEPIIAHFPETNSQSACIYSPLNQERVTNWYCPDCLYSPLNQKNGTAWYCADSRGNIGISNINPGSPGFCVNGQSAVCPPIHPIQTIAKINDAQQITGETAGWKVYKNENWGYEISYPQDWSFDNYTFREGDRVEVVDNSIINFLSKNGEKQISISPSIQWKAQEGYIVDNGVILNYSSPLINFFKSEPVKRFLGSSNHYYDVKNYQQSYIQFQQGARGVVKETVPLPSDRAVTFWFIDPAERLYSIDVYREAIKNQDIVDKVISTFKFTNLTTDQPPTITDMKNAYYNLEDYGNEPMKLTNGLSDTYDCGLNGEERCSAELFDQLIDFGDLNNDGNEEAAVILCQQKLARNVKNDALGNDYKYYITKPSLFIHGLISQIASVSLSYVSNCAHIESPQIYKGKIIINFSDDSSVMKQKVYLLLGDNLILQ